MSRVKFQEVIGIFGGDITVWKSNCLIGLRRGRFSPGVWWRGFRRGRGSKADEPPNYHKMTTKNIMILIFREIFLCKRGTVFFCKECRWHLNPCDFTLVGNINAPFNSLPRVPPQGRWEKKSKKVKKVRPTPGTLVRKFYATKLLK